MTNIITTISVWWNAIITNGIPRIPLGEWINSGITFLQREYSTAMDAIANSIEFIMLLLQQNLLAIPPLLFISIFALIAWYVVNKKLALFTVFGLYLIYNMQLWTPTIQTLSMVITAVLLCIIIGTPLGILAAKSNGADKVITPILDFMQTLPAFVYLLPAIFFFGLGVVPAVIATLIFAMPPVIRLTKLGIMQVPEELKELGVSFGSTFFQMLFKIEIPIARSTIMAGINQCIMLSLSMVVIASMIGARGLGGEVWRGIQRLDLAKGFEAGLAIVIIAIILDRITQNLGNPENE